MAKALHMMVRVLDERRSLDFYAKAFGLEIADRFDFDDFTLVYLRNASANLRAHRGVVLDARDEAVGLRRDQDSADQRSFSTHSRATSLGERLFPSTS